LRLDLTYREVQYAFYVIANGIDYVDQAMNGKEVYGNNWNVIS